MRNRVSEPVAIDYFHASAPDRRACNPLTMPTGATHKHDSLSYSWADAPGCRRPRDRGSKGSKGDRPALLRPYYFYSFQRIETLTNSRSQAVSEGLRLAVKIRSLQTQRVVTEPDRPQCIQHDQTKPRRPPAMQNKPRKRNGNAPQMRRPQPHGCLNKKGRNRAGLTPYPPKLMKFYLIDVRQK